MTRRLPKASAEVRAYLDGLPSERRAALEAIRAAIAEHIDPAFEEGIQYGMLAYYLPHSRYPAGYRCDPKQPLPFASVASQKKHIGLYLFCLYLDGEEIERFRAAWLATGQRLDMGKSCVRVRKLEELPLDVLAAHFARIRADDFVRTYEASLTPAQREQSARRSTTAAPAAPPKKQAAKKAVAKKAAKRTKKKSKS